MVTAGVMAVVMGWVVEWRFAVVVRGEVGSYVMMVVSVGRQPEKGVDVVAVVAAGGRRRRVEERGEWIG
ncbi:hypothetical protein Tco_0405079 [Tanacetum coccineum]